MFVFALVFMLTLSALAHIREQTSAINIANHLLFVVAVVFSSFI